LKGTGGLKGFEFSVLVSYIDALSMSSEPCVYKANDARVARGREIFNSVAAGCSTCHLGERGTDNAHHDVQSKTEADKGAKFNTPSLRFVGRGGPYFHDGRYANLRELLTDPNSKMGHTKHLNTDDLDSLEAYLRTL